ncbi:hypothetical protein DL96DRAFT_1822088, partial [Flagelloscypha sp. PMI_526]
MSSSPDLPVELKERILQEAANNCPAVETLHLMLVSKTVHDWVSYIVYASIVVDDRLDAFASFVKSRGTQYFAHRTTSLHFQRGRQQAPFWTWLWLDFIQHLSSLRHLEIWMNVQAMSIDDKNPSQEADVLRHAVLHAVNVLPRLVYIGLASDFLRCNPIPSPLQSHTITHIKRFTWRHSILPFLSSFPSLSHFMTIFEVDDEWAWSHLISQAEGLSHLRVVIIATRFSMEKRAKKKLELFPNFV